MSTIIIEIDNCIFEGNFLINGLIYIKNQDPYTKITINIKNSVFS
jgi:hypothetical protein